jgi:hypothetical protein
MRHTIAPARSRVRTLLCLAILACVPLASLQTFAFGAEPARSLPATTRAHVTPGAGSHAADASSTLAGGGLPTWTPPASYSVDMVITHGKDRIVMTRHIDGTRVRTDIAAAGTNMSMIELGDEAGTTLTVIPEQKMVLKQSRTAMMKAIKSMPGAPAAAAEPTTLERTQPPPDTHIEFLGRETLNGRAVEKYKASYPEGSATAWVDPETKAPVRMESADAVLEWENFKAAPQPAALFEAPKNFPVTDMDEMMNSVRGMKMPGGMSGMTGMGGMGGMSGAGGLNGMAGQYGQNLGSQLGSSFGAGLGASLGGPLGSMAGSYLGGKIGGMIGHRAATAITPGN